MAERTNIPDFEKLSAALNLDEPFQRQLEALCRYWNRGATETIRNAIAIAYYSVEAQEKRFKEKGMDGAGNE